MKRVLHSLVLLIAIFGSALPASSTPVAAAVDFEGGDGSAEDPYQIADWYQLDEVRNHLGDYFILLNNLDSSTDGYDGLAGPDANGGDGWQPIGTSGSTFFGTLDGRGYEIGDLVIDRGYRYYVGLFGSVGDGGVIEDLGVTGAVVTGADTVGGLVGYLKDGEVNNCYATGSVTGGVFAGGLTGFCDGGTVSNCYATESVTGDIYVGGLVGHCDGVTVSNCYATGSVTGDIYVGGLVGWCYRGTVSNCYASGSVTGDIYVGGLVGVCEEYGTVSNSFWDTDTSLQPTSDGGTGKTTAQMQDIATFTDTSTTGLDSRWNMVAGAPGVTYPYWTWNIVDGEDYPFLTFNRVQIKVSAGWNMISVPAAFCGGGNTVEDLFGDEIEAIYTWDAESKSYTAPTVLEPCRGYWVAVTEDRTITLHV